MSDYTQERRIRIVHVVEYVIKAKDDPGTKRNFMGDGLPPRSADQIIHRVIDQIKFQASRGDNPTATTAHYGGFHDLRQVGWYGNRRTTIELDDEVIATVACPKDGSR